MARNWFELFSKILLKAKTVAPGSARNTPDGEHPSLAQALELAETSEYFDWMNSTQSLNPDLIDEETRTLFALRAVRTADYAESCLDFPLELNRSEIIKAVITLQCDAFLKDLLDGCDAK